MRPKEQQMILIHNSLFQAKNMTPSADLSTRVFGSKGGNYHRGSIHASHPATPGLNRGSVEIFTALLLQLFRSNEISFLPLSFWIVERSNPSSALAKVFHKCCK